MPPRICIIFNPAASGEKAKRFRERLGVLAAQAALKPTLAPGGGRALAAEAVRQGFETIVAAGGDGTLNEVLNGIGDEPGGFARARLGVLPLGTVNVFAREISLPRKLDHAWDIILRGTEIRIDLGVAEFSPNGLPQRRYFAQLAGAGLDSRAIALVDWEQKKKLGALSYVLAGFKALWRPLPEIVASFEKETVTGKLILIGNGRFYGGPFRLFPFADLHDGLLEVTLFSRVGFLSAVRGGCAVLCNKIYSLGGARHFKTKRLTLSSPEPIPFQLEGENAGSLPAEFSVAPGLLRLLAPAKSESSRS